MAELIAAPSTPLLNGFAVCLLDVDDDHSPKKRFHKHPTSRTYGNAAKSEAPAR